MASTRERPPLPEGPYLVVGLARSGQAAARLLAARGEQVVGIDAGNPDGAERLRDAGVEVRLDGDSDEYLGGARCVVKSPGVPRQAPPVKRALTLGVPVLGELELAWRLIPNRFVAVTGTNGKTTVTELLGHVWRTASEPVAVAGNVGTPLTSLVDELDAGTTVICEVSSFQLEDASVFAPECAMLLNATPDHLDRHGTFEDYLAAKLRVFARQRSGDTAIVDRSDPAIAALTLPGDASELDVSTADLGLEAAGAWMIGPHNVANARFAAAAALAMGIDDDAVARGIETFSGVAHRLERVAEIGGVAYVNDSKATNVAAAVAALESFDGDVHAIMGGSLKGADFTALAEPVARRCAAVYLTGPATEPIAAALKPTGVPMVTSTDLAAALGKAASVARPGATVLLAPACASFDAYRDFEARGDHFRELVRAMEAAS
ncbi:MAG: UDP-N-acetylmuramoyl-L-alanine--D-glutamate ligase [Actinomycetota bacterium]|nr:UDP-N-acetylmuramoyl-L-alanine--D-glutamate ligase [Actinomycetota bacterium]